MMTERVQMLLLIALIFTVLAWIAVRGAWAQTAAPGMAQTPEETHLPEAVVTVPMKDAGPLPAVEVEVNGQGPFLFWVDTGGSGSGRADSALVEKLGLETVGEIQPRDGSGRPAPPMAIVRIDSIKVGGAEFKGIEAASRDYNRQLPPGFPQIDGILGFHLFHEALLTFDYAANELRLEKGELPPPDGKDILAFGGDGMIPTVTLEIAGKAVEAHIDTGFQGGLQLPNAMAEPLLAGEPIVVGRGRTVSGEFEIKEAPITGTVKVGQHAMDGLRVAMVPFDAPPLVGSGFLRNFTLTFDQKNNRVRFNRVAAPAGEPTRRVVRRGPPGAGPAPGPGPRYRIGVAFARVPGLPGMAVDQVFPGSAGEKAGLKKEDRIVAIAGRPVAEVPPEDLRKYFGSPDPVTLTVERGDETLELELVPQKVE